MKGEVYRSFSLSEVKGLIVDLLKSRGTMRYMELYKLASQGVEDLSHREFNRALMVLELNGIVRVTTLKPKVRAVELLGKG